MGVSTLRTRSSGTSFVISGNLPIAETEALALLHFFIAPRLAPHDLDKRYGRKEVQANEAVRVA